MNKRLTPSEIVENNLRIMKENNLRTLKEITAYTLKARLENKGE